MKRVAIALAVAGLGTYGVLVALALNTLHANTYVDPYDERDRVARVIYSALCAVDGRSPLVEEAGQSYVWWGRVLLLDARRSFLVSHRVLDRPGCIESIAAALPVTAIPTYVIVRNPGTGAEYVVMRGN